MSRIYLNEHLSNLPLNQARINEEGSSVFGTILNLPAGYLIECAVFKRFRYCLADSANVKRIVLQLNVKVENVHRRKYEEKTGNEIEPNFSDNQKVRTGYLNSSYDTRAKGTSDVVSAEALCTTFSSSPLSGLARQHHTDGCVALFIEETQLADIELADEDRLRLKTKGTLPVIESLVKLDTQSSTVQNYAGDAKVGSSWTDRVFAAKAQGPASTAAAAAPSGEGCADDEWDD